MCNCTLVLIDPLRGCLPMPMLASRAHCAASSWRCTRN
jgi:hypothetical protein